MLTDKALKQLADTEGADKPYIREMVDELLGWRARPKQGRWFTQFEGEDLSVYRETYKTREEMDAFLDKAVKNLGSDHDFDACPVIYGILLGELGYPDDILPVRKDY
jgi:hypothetical protein